MAQVSTFASRFDPYKNYKFQVSDGQQAYFGTMLTGLLPTAEVVDYRSGGDPSTPHKLPNPSKYNSLTLARGIADDPSFSNWASQVWNYGASLGSEVSTANFRKDLYLEFYNEAGQLIVSYRISHGWIYEHQLVPSPRLLQHNLNLMTGESVQEKMAALFQSSLDRTCHGTRR